MEITSLRMKSLSVTFPVKASEKYVHVETTENVHIYRRTKVSYNKPCCSRSLYVRLTFVPHYPSQHHTPSGEESFHPRLLHLPHRLDQAVWDWKQCTTEVSKRLRAMAAGSLVSYSEQSFNGEISKELSMGKR